MIFWIEFIILVKEGINLNAAAANNPKIETIYANSLFKNNIIMINKMKPRITNHSNQRRGSVSVKFCFISKLLNFVLFSVKTFKTSPILFRILIYFIEVNPSLRCFILNPEWNWRPFPHSFALIWTFL